MTPEQCKIHEEHTLHKKWSFHKDFFSKCDQIRSFLWIWSHLLKKSLMENFIFCAVITKILQKSTYLGWAAKKILISRTFKMLVWSPESTSFSEKIWRQTQGVNKFTEIQKYTVLYRSSRPEVFCNKGTLKIFAGLTGKHLC